MSKVLFMGVEDSGKTTLTASLVQSLELIQGSNLSLRPENNAAFLFSSRVAPAFAKGEFPESTTSLKQLKWSLVDQTESYLDLEVLDYPGEIYSAAFLDPEEQEDAEDLRHRQEKYAAEISSLMRYLASADMIFPLLDLEDATNLASDNRKASTIWAMTAALKCLKSIGALPKVTVLITRADRLLAAGEDLSDPHELLKRRIPVLASHFGDVNIRFVSALDCGNDEYGVMAILVDMLRKSEFYRKWQPKWQAYERRCYSGMAAPYDEGEIVKSAKIFAPFLEEARFAAHVSESLKHLEVVKAEINRAMNGMSGRMRRAYLKSMLAKEKDSGVRNLISQRLQYETADFGAIIFFFSFMLVLVLVIVVGVLRQ